MTDTEILIRSYYDAFNRRDFEDMLALLSEDVRHDVNEGGHEIGRDAFRAFVERMNRCYREHLTDIRVAVGEHGAYAAAEYVVHGEYIASDEGLPPAKGQKYVLPGGAYFDIKDGRIARVTNYYNLSDWIRQVNP
ncbi:ketosteroid isomerase-related protein [Rhizomicrobium palustre]